MHPTHFGASKAALGLRQAPFLSSAASYPRAVRHGWDWPAQTFMTVFWASETGPRQYYCLGPVPRPSRARKQEEEGGRRCVVSVHHTTWNTMTQQSTQLVHTSVITRCHSAVLVANLSHGSHMGSCFWNNGTCKDSQTWLTTQE